jgi:hypothetical protein
MGWRGPILLAVAAAGLAWFVWRGERPAPADTLATPALQGRTLTEAIELRLEHGPERPPILLRRGGPTGFRLADPVDDVASAGFLDALAAQWDAAKLTRFAAAGELGDAGLRDKGLLPPRAVFLVRFEDRELRFELGTQALLPDEIYLRLGDDVHRAPLALFSSLQGNVSDLRERLLVTSPPDQISRIEILRRRDGEPPSRLVLEREQRRWLITAPRKLRADTAMAVQVVQAVAGLRLDQFVPGNLNVRGDPDLVLALQGQYGAERIEFWREPGGTWLGHATPREVEFRLHGADLDRAFELPLAGLRSRLLLATPVEQLVRIRIEGAGTTPVDLQRAAGGSWRLHEPQVLDTDPTPVLELISALRNLGAEEFVADPTADPAAAGLEQGALQLELTDQFAREPLRLIIGAEIGGRVLARRADESEVVQVPAGAAAKLRRPWTDYAGLDVLSVGLAGTIPRLEIRSPTRQRVLALGADGRWREAGSDVVVPGVADVVDLLRELRAERAHDLSAHPLLGPGIRFSLQRENGDELGWIAAHDVGGRLLVQSPRAPNVLYELRERDARDLRALIE